MAAPFSGSERPFKMMEGRKREFVSSFLGRDDVLAQHTEVFIDKERPRAAADGPWRSESARESLCFPSVPDRQVNPQSMAAVECELVRFGKQANGVWTNGILPLVADLFRDLRLQLRRVYNLRQLKWRPSYRPPLPVDGRPWPATDWRIVGATQARSECWFRFLSEEEAVRLLEACRTSQNPFLYAIVMAALHTGLRRGEILGLTWKRVDSARRRDSPRGDEQWPAT